MGGAPLQSDRSVGRFPWRVVVPALLCIGFIRTLTLGLPAIGGSSEAREAHVIDVIVREGTWILPLRNGIIPSKPPLFHWIGAALAHLIGEVSELSVRLPSLLSALVVLLCVSFIAFRFSTIQRGGVHNRERYARRAAVLAMAVLSLIYEFHQMAAQAMVDMVFAACLWGAFAALCCTDVTVWRRDQRLSVATRALFWCCCALGFLARGPVGVVLPVLLAMSGGAFLVGLRRAWKEFLRSWPWWSFAVLPAAWFAAAYHIGGEAFIERQVIFENIRRVTGGDHVNNEAWWFYLPSFLSQAFPWSLCALLFAARDTALLREARDDHEKDALRLKLLPMLIAGVGILVFSCASGKRHSYLLAIYPCVAIYVASALNDLIEHGDVRVRQRLIATLGSLQGILSTAALVSVVALGLVIQGSIWMQSERILGALGGLDVWRLVRRACEGGSDVVVVLLLAGAFPLIIGVRTLRARALCVWASGLFLATALSSLGAYMKASFKGFPEMTHQIMSHLKHDEELVVIKSSFDEYFDPILYYMHRPVTVMLDSFEPSECRPGVIYLLRHEWLEELPSHARTVFSSVATVRESLVAARRDDSRELSLVRCDAQRQSPSENQPARGLQIASTSESTAPRTFVSPSPGEESAATPREAYRG